MPDDERGRWGPIDIAGAVGLAITASAVVAFAGATVDAFQSNGEDSPVSFIAGALGSAAVTFALARVTRLPLGISSTLLAIAITANVAVHIASGGGGTNVLGLSQSFIEAAILSGVPFGLAWLYVSKKHRRPLTDLGFVPPSSQFAFLYAPAAWIVALVGVEIWVRLVSDVETIAPPDNATPVLEIAGGSLAVAWLLVGLWGPVVEEIFFRGFLLGGIRRHMGAFPALLVSSGIFALFHIEPGLYVPTFLLGLAFGWVYLKTGSIWPPIVAHTLHNTLAIVAVWQESQ